MINKHLYLDRAQELVDAASKAGRRLTKAEKTEIEELLGTVEDDVAIRKAMDKAMGIGPESGGASNSDRGQFASTVLSAGLRWKENPSVVVSLGAALGKSTLPGAENWQITSEGVAPLGQDRRFLSLNPRG